MDTNIQTRQDFISELLAFSPKYNADLAEGIADQLSDQELSDTLEKLRRINSAEQKRLDELAQCDPAAYQQEMKAQEEQAQKSDEQYYGDLERDLVEESDEIDAVFTAHEQEVDKEEKKAQEEINKGFDDADKFLQSFFDELNKKEEASSDGQQPQTVLQ